MVQDRQAHGRACGCLLLETSQPASAPLGGAIPCLAGCRKHLAGLRDHHPSSNRGHMPPADPPCLLQVVDVGEGEVTCVALSSAVLDGLLTVMVRRCRRQLLLPLLLGATRFRTAVCRQLAELSVPASPQPTARRKAGHVGTRGGVCPLQVCHTEDEEFRGDFGLPLLTEFDVDCIKSLG